MCAAELANRYSLAQLAGTNGKSGFFNSMVNGVLGNTVSTIVSYAHGGDSAEFAATAYDMGTHAVEGSINSVTAPTAITELGLTGGVGGEFAGKGLGGIMTLGKLAYDVGSFSYAYYQCGKR
jgi:uncharacterized protein with beta-barrel porin domain